jgi:hypothetical protein
VALWHAFRLLLDKKDKLCCAIGGVACSLILALLVGSMGGQTFYPREGAVGLWCAIGLMFRVSLERDKAYALGLPFLGIPETADEMPLSSDSFLDSTPSKSE